MTFHELVEFRESVRNYDPDRPVEEAKLERILDAGRLAPSASNKQPWTFYVVSSPEARTKLHAAYQKSWFADAPHILVVAGKRGHAWQRQYDGYNALETDLTIAMDHIILAAASEGVGTCWIAAFDPQKLHDSQLFDKDETIFAITPLGYPRPGYKWGRPKIRKTFDEVVRYL